MHSIPSPTELSQIRGWQTQEQQHKKLSTQKGSRVYSCQIEAYKKLSLTLSTIISGSHETECCCKRAPLFFIYICSCWREKRCLLSDKEINAHNEDKYFNL